MLLSLLRPGPGVRDTRESALDRYNQW